MKKQLIARRGGEELNGLFHIAEGLPILLSVVKVTWPLGN